MFVAHVQMREHFAETGTEFELVRVVFVVAVLEMDCVRQRPMIVVRNKDL